MSQPYGSEAIRQAASGASERSRKVIENIKQKRQLRHKRNEGQRPTEQQITTRSDLDQNAQKYIARGTFNAYARTIRLFKEFSEDVLGLPPGSGDAYFQLNGPLPSTKMMRQFLFYLADGCQGRGPSGRICRRTAMQHAATLIGALQYCNRRIEIAVREQVMAWAQYDLTEELQLDKDLTRPKTTAHRADVSLILEKMMSPLGLRQLLSMRMLLGLAIFMNLMIDGCARIHEVISTEQYPNQYLRWKDLKIYVFKHEETGEITIAGLIKLSNLKGNKNRPEKWKEVPLMLMPSSLWLEDSLRLLIFTALLDGHIEGASTWEEFDILISSCSSNAGMLVPLRSSCEEWPLIPHIDHTTSTVQKDTPVKSSMISRHLARLGRLCGFKDILQSTAFRRGAAYTLESSVSIEQRTWAMGHDPGSKTFLKYYKAQTSTVDLQAMMHNHDKQRDVLKMSSIALGRSEDAPVSLSAKGDDIVMADPRIWEAGRKCTEMLDSLTERYPSIEAAKRDGSEEFTKWHETNKEYREIRRQLREAELRKEYDAFCQANSTLKVPVLCEPDCVDDPMLDKQAMYADVDVDPSCCLTLPEATESSSAAMDMSLIDPALLSPEDFAICAGQAKDDRFAGIIDHDKDEAEAVGEKVVSKDIDTRLHGTYRHHAKQRNEEGFCRESMICQEHRFDNLLHDTCKQPLSNSKPAQVVMPFFKTMHALERYGKLEPEPATFICPTCLDDQGSKSSFELHVGRCRTETVHANAKHDWTRDLQPKMAVPCAWQLKPGQTCGKTFTNLHKFCLHVFAHANSSRSKVCKFPPCQSLAKQPRYETLDAWRDHVATDHGLTWLSSRALVFFCSFCNDFVYLGISGPSKRVDHYHNHLPQAFQSIQKCGYNEVHSTVALAHTILSVRNPRFCIFCVHDVDLPADQRLAHGNEWTRAPFKKDTWHEHILEHFARIKGRTVHCPAAASAGAEAPMCSATKLYDPQELEQHCLEVHRLYRFKGLSTAAPPKPKVRSRKRALEAQAVDTSGTEGAQFRDDDSDGVGDENGDITTSKRDQTPMRRKRQHLGEVAGQAGGPVKQQARSSSRSGQAAGQQQAS